MSDQEIVALEERTRKVGGTGKSLFAHRSPFAPATQSSSPYTSSSFQSTSSVPYSPHVTGSKYFEGSDLEQSDEIIEEKICRDVPLGQTAYDAAHKTVFHLCREDHEVPEQVQHDCTDDDMIVSLTGQTAFDAAHKFRHERGNGGDHGHGGKAGKDGFLGKGNVSLPLGDEEEDWEIGDVGIFG